MNSSLPRTLIVTLEPPGPYTHQNLQERIIYYLDHIYRLLVIEEQPFMPTPFPDSPTYLPHEFPHESFIHKKNIDWIEGELRRVYQIQLSHVVPTVPTQVWDPLVWRLSAKALPLSSSMVVLRMASVEVDACVYRDQNCGIQITGSFIISAMKTSAQLNDGIHVTSRVDPLSSSHSMQVIEMWIRGGRVIRQLSRRPVRKRCCVFCQALLPPCGPSACAKHQAHQAPRRTK